MGPFGWGHFQVDSRAGNRDFCQESVMNGFLWDCFLVLWAFLCGWFGAKRYYVGNIVALTKKLSKQLDRVLDKGE